MQNLSVLAHVLIRIGDAAGSRYLYLSRLGVPDRAALEKKLFKNALMQAKEFLVTIGDKHGEAYVLHNLANQLRFCNELDSAEAITNQVIELAKELKDERLLQQAQKLS